MTTNQNEEQKPQGNSVQNDQPFESDAKKLSDEHMADPNHIITEEDMRKIKIGVTGAADAPTKEAVKEAEDRIADRKADSEDDVIPGAEKTTPWDVIS